MMHSDATDGGGGGAHTPPLYDQFGHVAA